MGTGCSSIHIKFYAEGESKDELVAFVESVRKKGKTEKSGQLRKLLRTIENPDVTAWVKYFDKEKLEAHFEVNSAKDLWELASYYGAEEGIKRLFTLLYELDTRSRFSWRLILSRIS